MVEKITKRDIKENIEEMENALKRNDSKTAAEAAKFLLLNANFLSIKESMKVSGLVRKMLEKAKENKMR